MKLNGRDEDKREGRETKKDERSGVVEKRGKNAGKGRERERERDDRGTRTKITDDPAAVCLLLNSC